ncbi:MAG: hypothetical protein ACJASY_002311 [Halioglobus sp.]|jgi:hypothetical protein
MKLLKPALTLGLLLCATTVSVRAVSTTLVIFPLIRSVESVSTGDKTTIALHKLVRIVASREQREALSALEVPVATLRGRSRISKASVVDLLRLQPELSDAEIVGPEWITVMNPGHVATQEKVLAEAKQALLGHIKASWPDRYRNIEISHRGEGGRLPVGLDSSWSFDLSTIENLSRRTPLWLVVSNPEKTERTVLWFKVSGEQLVWLAGGRLEAKSSAQEAHFSQRWVGLNEIKHQNLAAPSGQERITVAMSLGDMLTKKHLERTPDVEFGEEAVVISKVGDVEIRATATVMRTAFVGEFIEMQSKSSNERFEAQVMDKSLVKISSHVH